MGNNVKISVKGKAKAVKAKVKNIKQKVKGKVKNETQHP